MTRNVQRISIALVVVALFASSLSQLATAQPSRQSARRFNGPQLNQTANRNTRAASGKCSRLDTEVQNLEKQVNRDEKAIENLGFKSRVQEIKEWENLSNDAKDEAYKAAWEAVIALSGSFTSLEKAEPGIIRRVGSFNPPKANALITKLRRQGINFEQIHNGIRKLSLIPNKPFAAVLIADTLDNIFSAIDAYNILSSISEHLDADSKWKAIGELVSSLASSFFIKTPTGALLISYFHIIMANLYGLEMLELKQTIKELNGKGERELIGLINNLKLLKMHVQELNKARQELVDCENNKEQPVVITVPPGGKVPVPDGLYSDPGGMLVFTYSLRDIRSNRYLGNLPEDNISSIPGINPDFVAAIEAERQLLEAAEATSDVRLKHFLITAAGAANKQDVQQSTNPAYYAYLSEQYRQIQEDELEPLIEMERKISLSQSKDKAAALLNILAEQDKVITKLNKIMDIAMRKLPPGGRPDSYIPAFKSNPGAAARPVKRSRPSSVTLINRTGKEIIAFFGGITVHLNPDTEFAKQVTRGGYPISALIASPANEGDLVEGRSFLAVAEDKHYVITIALAKSSGMSSSDQSAAVKSQGNTHRSDIYLSAPSTGEHRTQSAQDSEPSRLSGSSSANDKAPNIESQNAVGLKPMGRSAIQVEVGTIEINFIGDGTTYAHDGRPIQLGTTVWVDGRVVLDSSDIRGRLFSAHVGSGRRRLEILPHSGMGRADKMQMEVEIIPDQVNRYRATLRMSPLPNPVIRIDTFTRIRSQ